VRAEVGAEPDEPVAVTEFLKPGLDEFCSVLPRPLAAALRRLAERRGIADRLSIGLQVRTTSVGGFLSLWLVSKLRRWRRGTARYAQEQALIGRWLDAVRAAAGFDYDLALEIVECARLIKGYGDTHRRGLGNFGRLMQAIVEPALAAGAPSDAAADLAKARAAALGDPDGDGLAQALAELGATAAAEPPSPAVAAGE
jgi:indolepyruvate ferredoxin oxidoreductase beta subunit